MTYMNQVELKGFIRAEAQPKSIDGGKTVLNFSVATKLIFGKGETRQERTEWHRVTAWDKIANAVPTITKGPYVYVIGSLRSREYSNPEDRVQTYDIVATKIELLLREGKPQVEGFLHARSRAGSRGGATQRASLSRATPQADSHELTIRAGQPAMPPFSFRSNGTRCPSHFRSFTG